MWSLKVSQLWMTRTPNGSLCPWVALIFVTRDSKLLSSFKKGLPSASSFVRLKASSDNFFTKPSNFFLFSSCWGDSIFFGLTCQTASTPCVEIRGIGHQLCGTWQCTASHSCLDIKQRAQGDLSTTNFELTVYLLPFWFLHQQNNRLSTSFRFRLLSLL